MSKYVNKVGQLRKGNSEKTSLSPYSQNPHQPDYANVSKISTSPEPSHLNHPLHPSSTTGPSSTVSVSTSTSSSSISTTPPETSSKAARVLDKPSRVGSIPAPKSSKSSKTSSNAPNASTRSNSNASGPSGASRSIPSIPLPRPVRGSKSSTPSRAQGSGYPKAPLTSPQGPTQSRRGGSGASSNLTTPGRSGLPQLSKNTALGTGGSGTNALRLARTMARDRERQKLASRRSIFDLSLNANRSKQVSLSAFSYLFCELINYCQQGILNIAQLEERLSEIGYSVGTRQLELVVYRNKPGKREIDRIGILEFIQKTLWKRLFQKPADGLEQSMGNKNEFFIIDNAPVTNTFVSVPDSLGQLNCASFIGGIVHGVLENAGFPCKVITHETPMEQEQQGKDKHSHQSRPDDAGGRLQRMRTVFIVRFS